MKNGLGQILHHTTLPPHFFESVTELKKYPEIECKKLKVVEILFYISTQINHKHFYDEQS